PPAAPPRCPGTRQTSALSDASSSDKTMQGWEGRWTAPISRPLLANISAKMTSGSCTRRAPGRGGTSFVALTYSSRPQQGTAARKRTLNASNSERELKGNSKRELRASRSKREKANAKSELKGNSERQLKSSHSSQSVATRRTPPILSTVANASLTCSEQCPPVLHHVANCSQLLRAT